MPNRESKKELALILIVAIPFLFGALSSTTFLDPDEGMYGSIAKEMAGTGDWITPRFDGVRYLNKPPLYFWLSALTIYLFGPSEWSVRLWSALPALGTAILTWRLGQMLYGGRAGLLSAMILVSSVGVFRYARVAATDFLLVFSVTLAIYGFVNAVFSSSSVLNRRLWVVDQRWRLVFYLGMALGVLSKGLIGVVFPLLIVGLYGLLNGITGGSRVDNPSGNGSLRHLLSPFYSFSGLLLFLVLVLPWHVLAAWKNPGFFEFYILDNQFLRFLNRRAFIEDDVPITTLAFLLLTFMWFFPWSFFLPASFRFGFSRVRMAGGPAERLGWVVGLWALAVLGFFSLSSSKLEHYYLPAVPALSLMIGGMWAGASGLTQRWSIGSRPFRGFKWCLGLGALVCFLEGLGLLLFSGRLTPQLLLTGLAELNVYYRILKEQGASFPFQSVSPFVTLLQGLGAMLVVGLPLSFVLFQMRFPKMSFGALLVGSAGIFLLVSRLDLLVEPHHSSYGLAQALLSNAGPSDTIVHAGSLEYSGGLPFYTGRQIYVLNGTHGSLDFGSRFRDSAYLFLDEEQFARLWNGKRRVFLVSRGHGKESGLDRLASQRIFFVGQYGSRWLYANR